MIVLSGSTIDCQIITLADLRYAHWDSLQRLAHHVGVVWNDTEETKRLRRILSRKVMSAITNIGK